MIEQGIQQETVVIPAPLIISDLQVKSVVRGWLLVMEAQSRVAKNGKSYRHMKLRDQRGNTIAANQFDLPRNETLVPQEGKVVLLEGVVEEFNNETVLKLSRAQLDEVASPDLFLLGTRRPIAQIEEHFQELSSRVYHPGLYELLHSCFSDEVTKRFRHWPAAARYRQTGGARRGGRSRLHRAGTHVWSYHPGSAVRPETGRTCAGPGPGNAFRPAAYYPGASRHERSWLSRLPGHHRGFDCSPGRCSRSKTHRDS